MYDYHLGIWKKKTNTLHLYKKYLIIHSSPKNTVNYFGWGNICDHFLYLFHFQFRNSRLLEVKVIVN